MNRLPPPGQDFGGPMNGFGGFGGLGGPYAAGVQEGLDRMHHLINQAIGGLRQVLTPAERREQAFRAAERRARQE